MSQERIKLVIVDDHRIMREGLRLLIDRQPDMQVVGEAGDAAGALQCALRCSPDLVVMDLHLPDESGVEAARKIFQERPATKVVMLSSQLDPFYVQAALRAGVSGYVLKENASEDLLRAIRTVHEGQTYLCPGVTTTVVRDYQKQLAAKGSPSGSTGLSRREERLLRLITEGRRNKEIAQELEVGTKSIETYRSRLMKKLNCRNTAELVRYAIRQNLISP